METERGTRGLRRRQNDFGKAFEIRHGAMSSNSYCAGR
jgi:hypothetical protein